MTIYSNSNNYAIYSTLMTIYSNSNNATYSTLMILFIVTVIMLFIAH